MFDSYSISYNIYLGFCFIVQFIIRHDDTYLKLIEINMWLYFQRRFS